MKKILTALLLAATLHQVQAQRPRPDVCKACVMDTTGGYTSIADTDMLNPVCNYELLTAAHLNASIQQNRDSIPFFPHALDELYGKSGFSRGHCIPFEDMAYSPVTAKASMNLKRNLAPQPQPENIGTKLACENFTRQLAKQFGSVKVYGGTTGSVGSMKGINEPAYYWTVIITPAKTYAYYMPTTGPKIGYKFLNDPDIAISYQQLVADIGFDPEKVLPE